MISYEQRKRLQSAAKLFAFLEFICAFAAKAWLAKDAGSPSADLLLHFRGEGALVLSELAAVISGIALVRSKELSWWLGFLGLLNLFGLIIVYCLPDPYLIRMAKQR